MKGKLCMFLWCLVGVLSFSGVSFALVTGSGSMNLLVPDDGSFYPGNYSYGASYNDPDTGEAVSVSRYFGHISEYPGAYLVYGLNENYQGSGSYHDSEVTGSLNPQTGSQQYTFQAVSPDPGNVAASSGIDFYWGGHYHGVLDGSFGYNYSFTGQKDSPTDTLTFVIQMEIQYKNANNEWVDVYSDYGPYSLVTDKEKNYRTNWVYLPVVESGQYEGAITFDYSDFGEQDWLIRWDFGGYGRDTVGDDLQAPVPEPSTMILLGCGLLGLGGLARRFKKNR